jgi:hypothetical protein
MKQDDVPQSLIDAAQVTAPGHDEQGHSDSDTGYCVGCLRLKIAAVLSHPDAKPLIDDQREAIDPADSSIRLVDNSRHICPECGRPAFLHVVTITAEEAANGPCSMSEAHVLYLLLDQALLALESHREPPR